MTSFSHISSQVVPCLAMFDTMKHIGSDVATVGFGACMGMSGFLLSVGKKVRRSSSPSQLRTQRVSNDSGFELHGALRGWNCSPDWI